MSFRVALPDWGAKSNAILAPIKPPAISISAPALYVLLLSDMVTSLWIVKMYDKSTTFALLVNRSRIPAA